MAWKRYVSQTFIIEISNGSWGSDYIIFDTDIHGYIKEWKEKNIKHKIIIYLIQECIEDKYWKKNLIVLFSLNTVNLKFYFLFFLHLRLALEIISYHYKYEILYFYFWHFKLEKKYFINLI